MAINDIEFLRYLINYIDSKKESEIEIEPKLETAPTIIIVNKEEENDDQNVVFGDESSDEWCDGNDVENALDRDDVFIPPLQAKLEIMKKMAGIEPKNQDLLASAADEDEPFDG